LPGGIITNTAVQGTNPVWIAPGTNLPSGQLAAELQTLQGAVDRTLPLLRAFNQQSSHQGHGVVGALANVLSKGSQGGGAGQQITNLLSALGSLVSTNAQGAATINPETLKNLSALENELGPVAQRLQALHLGGTNQVVPLPPGSVPAPTGR
jgi:hypothetical protein